MMAAVNEEPKAEHTYQYLPVAHFKRMLGAKKRHRTYGLQVFEDGRELFRLKDVTMDMAMMVRMTYMCNEGNLEPCHLFEVIENFFGGEGE